MTDARERIRGQIESLTEELRTIPPHRFNQQKIEDRKRGIALLRDQLAGIERRHQNFLDRRAELAATFYQFAANGGGR
jgi:hypothetical protein